jgi:hypothetical protein
LVLAVAADLMVVLVAAAVRSDITRRNHCLVFHQLIFGLAQVEVLESGAGQDLVVEVLQQLNGVEQLNILQMAAAVLAGGIPLGLLVDLVDLVVRVEMQIAMDRREVLVHIRNA